VDPEFWARLSELADIIKLIHDAQKKSESDSLTLAHVMPRWLQLEHELKALAQVYLYLEPVLAPSGIFNERLNTQTQPIHWAAFILDPISSLRVINAEGKKLAIKWILDKVKHQKEVHCSIQDFLSKEGAFTKAHISQLHIDNPVRYWKSYFGDKHYDELAQLAVRIFKTIANSVASERAFSAMGLIVTKLRNRLGPEKADKLIFIYMNQRVLDRSGRDLLLGDWVDKSDKDQADLEDMLVSLEQELEELRDSEVELDIEHEDC